ncbi:MAG: hypothetical protein IPK26_16965 [Planctomycetes bacterium]|nr:hypothetical protein [Planctomycetota bacterium]
MRELQGIPPAPRQVRLGTLLACRWPLLATGALLVVYGCLWSLMLWFAAGAKPAEQRALDVGPVATTNGQVVAVDAPVAVGDRQLFRLTYRFSWGGTDWHDFKSFGTTPNHAVGDTVQIELLPGNPATNRIVGTLLHIDLPILRPEAWLLVTVVPGCLLLLGWLASVFHLRRVIAYGDVGVATVTGIAPVRFVLPAMLRIDYEFKDHHAQPRRGRHWVRAHGGLGIRLQRALHGCRIERVPVLHDRRHPEWSRLAQAEDFVLPIAMPTEVQVGE